MEDTRCRENCVLGMTGYVARKACEIIYFNLDLKSSLSHNFANFYRVLVDS